MHKDEYRKICIDTLVGLAETGDIEAMVLLIDENHQKTKWTDKLAEIVLTGADDYMDEGTKELIANVQKKAAQKLLKITKKMSDEVEISVESIAEIRDM